MLTDIEIAQAATPCPITEIAEKAGISEEYLECYGKTKAKVDYNLLRNEDHKPGKLVLVTAINPTAAGEGKTTTTVGLGDALSRLGKKTVIALREPSLGPVFGIKGGAAGGGYSLWKKSTCISRATSMPLARQTICLLHCSMPISTTATSLASMFAALRGSVLLI